MEKYLLVWEDGTLEQVEDSDPPPHELLHAVQEGVLSLIRYQLDEYQEIHVDGKWFRV